MKRWVLKVTVDGKTFLAIIKGVTVEDGIFRHFNCPPNYEPYEACDVIEHTMGVGAVYATIEV